MLAVERVDRRDVGPLLIVAMTPGRVAEVQHRVALARGAARPGTCSAGSRCDHCRAAIGWFCPPRPSDVSTTNPGRSSASLPRPYVTHEPMLGRPAICEPVFMNMWAGSWLIASVVIERMKQMSSMTEPICGNSSQISIPLCAELLETDAAARSRSAAAPATGRSAAPCVKLSGIGWPSISPQLRLGIERLEMRRPAGHRQPDDPLRPLRQREGGEDAVSRLGRR